MWFRVYEVNDLHDIIYSSFQIQKETKNKLKILLL
jgi:hypothetical protein